jgi:hypothetical protein
MSPSEYCSPSKPCDPGAVCATSDTVTGVGNGPPDNPDLYSLLYVSESCWPPDAGPLYPGARIVTADSQPWVPCQHTLGNNSGADTDSGPVVAANAADSSATVAEVDATTTSGSAGELSSPPSSAGLGAPPSAQAPATDPPLDAGPAPASYTVLHSATCAMEPGPSGGLGLGAWAAVALGVVARLSRKRVKRSAVR